MDLIFWISVILKILSGIVVLGLVGFVAFPLVLAEITRQRNAADTTDKPISSLYVGRVWHARLQPKYHGFNYSLFFFALDLEEVDDLFSNKLWPLSLVVNFRNEDHLKNGEGGPRDNEKCEIAHRVLRMVAEKTKNSFQPTLETHRVIVVTHLCYYGYCFNPVSFYYLQNKKTLKMDTVVAEVSNTPWNEMHCYVLHPDSIDEVQVQEAAPADSKNESINYVWPKRFHVSPFMEMTYMYDWTFTNFQLQPKTESEEDDPLFVRASMKRDGQAHFTAKVDCARKGLHPYTIAWQLIYFPIYCFIIQVWIHYEAFWLFVKGITFIPHPNDTETAISRAIAAVMTPLFALKDRLDQVRRKSSSSIPAVNSSEKTGAPSIDKEKVN
jgi:uncharacterized protein